MKRKRWVVIWGMLLLVVFSLLTGCGGKGKAKVVKTIEGDPELLYKRALVLFNKRDYSEALKQFEQLRSSFPDSPPYTLLAELKIGDSHFLKKDYVQAIAAYEEFKKIHPTHEEIPYVLYQIGMSYFNQMHSPDRDQTPTKKALSSFEYLIANTSPSLFTEKAKEKVGICRKRLFEHEFYIGNFYFKKGRFEAAAARFEGVLEKFPKTPDEDKTLFLLGQSYLELGEWEKARGPFNRILAEFPNSSYAKDARKLLDRSLAKKKASTRKAKTQEPGKGGKTGETEPGKIALIKFEEESRKVSLLKEESVTVAAKEERGAPLPDTPRPIQPVPAAPPPQKKVEVEVRPAEERRVAVKPASTHLPQEEPGRGMGREPDLGKPAGAGRTSLPAETKKGVELKTEEEKRVSALPKTAAPPERDQKAPKRSPLEPKLVETSEPIDITSDRVEAYAKENLIIFKGNVMARQKDMVIYADSIEAVIIEEGKGIERVTAGGNVKIQQGLRVASCTKAVFYNLDQKVILTGNPRVWEGDNVVSGDEIIFDIEKNQVEVKGGPSGRGKVKIHPGEFERLK